VEQAMPLQAARKASLAIKRGKNMYFCSLQ
jgi:hypothetical protein